MSAIQEFISKPQGHLTRKTIAKARRYERACDAMDCLLERETEPSWIAFMGSVSASYRQRGAVTIKQAKVLFWRLIKHNVNWNAADFDVWFRLDRDEDLLRSMPAYQRDALVPSLNSEGQAFVRGLERSALQSV